MNLLHKLRLRFSEPYRIRVGCGLSPIRTKREMKALIAFCESELKDRKHMRLNPHRQRVYEMTLKLYKQRSSKAHNFKPVIKTELYNDANEFIDDHIGWYWS